MKIKFAPLTALIIGSTLVLAGCSGTSGDVSSTGHGGHSGGSTPEASVDANAADLMFAAMMIGHHQQAIEMSDIVLAKSGVDEQVVALAERIKAAQQPEIDQLTEWVTAWGGDVADYTDMGHGDGMMSADDMAALESADGPQASVLFLEQMIVHHEGAVEMAEEEVGSGQNPDAITLAEKIITDQKAEISEMQDLLDTLR
ncbi:hypothetical protein GCM10009860_04690 [Microbacterium mitrae]|uniref:DUF305 domain-containing protein n=1 Tax=Microbacterium mitrae TaxID=664640 RepID=A0A5C8HPF3_9MICO|nr:DUF305 domain-containing protein [Microbacterium mitrae]TXK05865.1 DUF305 domain-containing protein [Microbacterium mitrae]